MISHLKKLSRTGVCLVSLTIGLTLTAASQAATLKGDTEVKGGTSLAGSASSGLFGRWRFSDFSLPPVIVNARTITNTQAIGSDGTMSKPTDSTTAIATNAQSNATANADFSLVSADTQIQTGALAIGPNTTAFGQSLASTPGRFQIGAGQTFKFNFQGFLGMGNALTNANSGTAEAKGNLSLLLYDVTDAAQPILLDFLDLTAQLNTPGDERLPSLNYSNNFKINRSDIAPLGLGSFQESLEAFIVGSFQRRFEKDTVLAFASTSEPVPEPSTILASIACGAAIVKLRRRFGKTKASS